MSKERECAETLRAIVGKEPFPTFVAKVTKVDGAKCTVQRLFDDMEIEEVRLNCSTTEEDGIVIEPEVGSMVLITSIDGRYWFVSQFSAVTNINIHCNNKIVINDGNNAGLVNVGELKKKFNALVEAFNNHVHQVSTEGTAEAQEGTAIAVEDKAFKFDDRDIEDKSVTH